MANTNYPSAENPQGSNRPSRNSNNTTKNIIIGVLAAGLLGTWAYFLYDKNDSNKQIQEKTASASQANTERDAIKAEYDATLVRLDSLTGDNNNKAGVISERESEISKLK